MCLLLQNATVTDTLAELSLNFKTSITTNEFQRKQKNVRLHVEKCMYLSSTEFQYMKKKSNI